MGSGHELRVMTKPISRKAQMGDLKVVKPDEAWKGPESKKWMVKILVPKTEVKQPRGLD